MGGFGLVTSAERGYMQAACGSRAPGLPTFCQPGGRPGVEASSWSGWVRQGGGHIGPHTPCVPCMTCQTTRRG